MANYHIAVIPGDGIGKEVIPSGGGAGKKIQKGLWTDFSGRSRKNSRAIPE